MVDLYWQGEHEMGADKEQSWAVCAFYMRGEEGVYYPTLLKCKRAIFDDYKTPHRLVKGVNNCT